MEKKIFVTESQLNKIKNMLNEDKIKIKTNGNFINPKKVLLLKDYLDKAFKRGNLETIDDDGYPKNLPIVAMMGASGNILRNMTDVQLFYLLQDRFKSLYADKTVRDKFLIQVIKDWFYDKISKEGLLSVNMF